MIRRASYNEPALTPLPYNTEISDNNTIFNPRSSFTKHLQRSSYLFPKRKSSLSSDTEKQQHYPRTMNRVTLDHHDNDSNKKMRYNDRNINMRLKELYSVSAFEDTPTISQSPTDARGDMNTKQDQHCNVKPPPLCGLTTDNNNERHVTNIMTDSIMNNNNNDSSDRKKKSVSFLPQVTTKHPPSSLSTSTSQNKTQLWYTPNEYNQFKYQAALDCGIKLMQLNNVSSSQKNDGKRKRRGQFIQVGDFDCKKNENINGNTTNLNVAAASSSHPSSSSMDTPPTDNTKDKKYSRYYNENEYNDCPVEEQSSCAAAAHGKIVELISNKPQQQQEEEPTVVCKRGLGYHFSRTRKRARMSTRSAVLAWQKNLRGASNTTSNSQATANDKSTMMLALVSSKCSRVAREEAKWRGLVDYKVAYPERHQDLLHQASIANDKVQLDNDMNDKKRPNDSTVVAAAAPIIHTDTARCAKRQRSNNDGNDTNKMQRRNGAVFDTGTNRDELILSPETVGYLVNGVQYAKV